MLHYIYNIVIKANKKLYKEILKTKELKSIETALMWKKMTPNLHTSFFISIFQKTLKIGQIQHQFSQISFETVFLVLKNPLMPIFLGKELRQKLRVF
jgi:hypothetical protein